MGARQIGRLAAVGTALWTLLAAASTGAQTFDDADAQLKVRQATNATAAAQRDVDELKTALDEERKRTVASDTERDLNRGMIDNLQKKLKLAEEKLKERQEALAAAQEARKRGLAAQPQPPSLEEEERRRAAGNEAQAAEAQLGLGLLDRQHVQVALTALGFNTGGSDGALGPRSREAIAAWQKARGLPSSGFLARPQLQALLGEAQVALAKFDTDLKKADEERKAEEEARRKAAAAAPPPPPAPAPAPAPAPPPSGPRAWLGSARCENWQGVIGIRLAPGQSSGRWNGKFSSYVTLSLNGNQVSGTIHSPNKSTQDYYLDGQFSGTIAGDRVSIKAIASIPFKPAGTYGPQRVECEIVLTATN